MSEKKRRVRYSSKSREASTAKRQVNRVAPSSPWQVLVTRRAEYLGLSWREIHEALGSAGPKEHSTVWSWTRRPKGYPTTEAYTPEVNERLAHVLKLSPRELAEAYEESRRHPVASPSAGPKESSSGVAESSGYDLPLDPDVRRMVESEARRTRLSFKEVLNATLRKSLRPVGGDKQERFVVEAADMGAFAGAIGALEDDLEVAAFLEATRKLEASLKAP